jgi:peptide/nickel transport system substrate-binding protein
VLGHEAVTSRLQSADFDMAITGYTIGAHPSMLFYHMHTSRGEIEDGRVSGYNYGGISIPEIDAVLNRIWMSFEEAALKQAFVDLQSMIAEFVPAVPICVPNKVEAYSTKRFTNWQISDADGVFTSETLRVLQPK